VISKKVLMWPIGNCHAKIDQVINLAKHASRSKFRCISKRQVTCLN